MAMRWTVASALALLFLPAVGVSTAAPVAGPTIVKPTRPILYKLKPVGDTFPIEIIDKWIDAVILEKAGDFDGALDKFRRMRNDFEHPHVHYNIAELCRRLEWYPQATEAYEKYLEVAPDAADRAEIERIMKAIDNRPARAVIEGEDPNALVFVNGKLMGPSPVHVEMPEGSYVVDRISPTKHTNRFFIARRGRTEEMRVFWSSKEERGNVVISASPNYRDKRGWQEGGHKLQVGERFSLPPGRFETTAIKPEHFCSKIVFDVPAENQVVYVYLDVGKPTSEYACLPVKVTQQKLRFQ